MNSKTAVGTDTLILRGAAASADTFAVVIGPNHADPEETLRAIYAV